MLIVVTVLLSDFIPLRERGTYQAYLNLIGAVGSTSGGPIGQLLFLSHSFEHVRLTFKSKEVFLCRPSDGDGEQNFFTWRPCA